MSEQKKKITQEEEFKKNLSGDLLKNVLDFAAYMDNSLSWKHLGEDVCFAVTNSKTGNFHLFFGHHKGSLCFRSADDNGEYGNYSMDESMKEFVWANVNQCNHFKTNGQKCGCGQQPGYSFTILGKAFDNLCNCPIMFMNPNIETFEKIKELVETWKLCIEEAKRT